MKQLNFESIYHGQIGVTHPPNRKQRNKKEKFAKLSKRKNRKK